MMFVPRHALIALLVATGILAGVVLAAVPAGSARVQRPRLSFAETYRDVRTDKTWTQQGRVTVTVTLPLAGVSLRSLSRDTPFIIGLGGVVSTGVLGDDPAYRPGKRKARVREGGRVIRLEWDRRQVTMTLTVITGRSEPSALAADRMADPDGKFEGVTRSFNTFAERNTGLEISFKGEKTTRDGILKVTMRGAGNTDCGCGTLSR